ncbi:MAG: HEPN domain-containing protein, partial [Thaumarchaeota archaeon]|nr:HEPN domain-containing protein [Nitrososphaerota archaeon]
MTRSVDQSKATNYLTKAENSLRIAKIALEEKAYDTAVMDAVHSSINALDALTTLYSGKRSSGQHTDVYDLIKGILTNDEFEYVKKQFSGLLSMKNESEYQPNLMNDKDAENAVMRAERILNKVQTKIKK